MDEAEAQYRAALAVDPANLAVLCNYAHLQVCALGLAP